MITSHIDQAGLGRPGPLHRRYFLGRIVGLDFFGFFAGSYVAQPPIAASRQSALDDGRLLFHLKKRWRAGTKDVVSGPLEFIARLAALS